MEADWTWNLEDEYETIIFMLDSNKILANTYLVEQPLLENAQTTQNKTHKPLEILEYFLDPEPVAKKGLVRDP